MDATEVLSTLGISDATEVLAPHWEESAALLRSAPPAFLDPAIITESREYAQLPAEVDPALHEVAGRVAAWPELLHLAWHCYRVVYEYLDYPGWPNTRQWPHPIAPLGDLTGAFYLLIALGAIPRMRAVHEQLGIPEAVSRASCSHYPTSLRIYREHHGGHFGFAPRAVYWVRHHALGHLYRLGRLEYMVKPFRGPLVAYRHRQTRVVVALAEEGTRFDEEGLLAFDDQSVSSEARLVIADDTVTGTPLSPFGHAESRQVELPLGDWERALAPGDPILEVHIPAGGDMTPENCRASMQQALAFFPRYFADKPFAGFACGSWILNPELERIYRPDSNMVLWQRELYLFPAFGGRGSIYFIFGRDDVDIATAPRDSSLRRALLDHLAVGGRLLGGGMFMLQEDFSEFGTQVYRRQWPSVSAST